MLDGIQYTLHWPVAEGGAGGIVYLASGNNGRVVAIKLHIKNIDGENNAPADFQGMIGPRFVSEASREAERQTLLAGPRIAQLYHHEPAAGGFPNMSVMELARGVAAWYAAALTRRALMRDGARADFAAARSPGIP